MTARKLQQDIDKTFKKVAEGVQAFEGIFEKIQQSTNASQKEKLEDNLKREIKKLQRHRDQIKTWAAGNDIKDKKPLLEQRKLIENEMEKFKAVEKEMKTKAFSKEGLSLAAKLDPKEREKLDTCQFLSDMVEELERQIETLEAEEEALQATVKKGKRDTSKADRLSEISRSTERHKWHQTKLELLLRLLENGGVDTEQVNDVKDGIKYYVEENQTVEFMEDDTIYDDFNLDQEESSWGIAGDGDRVSSQDTQSIQEDVQDNADTRPSIPNGKPKPPSMSEAPISTQRRPSNTLKSPLPALATLHAPLGNVQHSAPSTSMKPAPAPTRPPGETLKYASAAAAGAASDKNGVGIAPLPPPPGASSTASGPSGLAPLPAPVTTKSSTTSSPIVAPSLPVSHNQTPAQKPAQPVATESSATVSARSPTPSHSSAAAVPSVSSSKTSSIPATPALEPVQKATTPHLPPTPTLSPPPSSAKASEPPQPISRAPKEATPEPEQPQTPIDPPVFTQQQQAPQTNGEPHIAEGEDESIYHLPSDLKELIQSFEITKTRPTSTSSPSVQRMLQASYNTAPDITDIDKPRHYRPTTKYATPPFYPQEPAPIVDDANLYNRIDTDTLFFIFYYRQGTYQQYLAAKSLKQQSWRFHKQYQTWFQRHEEPKSITEEHEQGTYRFFDWESTWMNRRKADFKFAYRYLEDDM